MYKKIKRVLDLIFSIILLPVALIIICICAIFIKKEDRGPVFYISNRLGINGSAFKMYKLRTMKVGAPDIRLEDGSTWNAENDFRVTKIGKLLRKTSLDEVPQILNILKGEMSFVGPRPDPCDWLEKYGEKEKVVFTLAPGLTGYNQAFFRNSSDGKTKMKNDVFYAENISLALDIKILIKTFFCVFSCKSIYK